MADRPILFSTPMVRALLAGTKTQTRRALSEQPPAGQRPVRVLRHPEGAASLHAFEWRSLHNAYLRDVAIRFAVGDRLWVREAWNAFNFSQDGDVARPCTKIPTLDEVKEIAEEAYRFGPPQVVYRESSRAREWFSEHKWRPGIHMPRWASRLTLSVTGVRVQRLQEISEADAAAEGVPEALEGSIGDEIYCPKCQGFGVHAALGENLGVTEIDCDQCVTAKQRYANLWDHINGAGAWAANPWVSVTSFTVHHQNIDALKAREAA